MISFLLALLFPLISAAPTDHFTVNTLSPNYSFNLHDHLVSVTGAQEQVLIIDHEIYNNTSFYKMDYPILVMNEETNNWRFISRPVAASGWRDFFYGDADKETPKDKNPPTHEETRFEIQGSSSLPYLLMPKIPASACVDTTHGSGGSVGKTISFTFNSGVSGTFGLADSILNFLKVSLTVGVSSSIGLQFSVTCSANAGESVQIFLSPWALRLTTSYREIIEYQNGVRAESNSWSEFFSSEWGINVPPETYCVTSSKLACTIPGLDGSVHLERLIHV